MRASEKKSDKMLEEEVVKNTKLQGVRRKIKNVSKELILNRQLY